jgi:hypothetical protein
MLHTRGATGLLAHLEGAMKVGLLGTGFGIAHARIYHTHPQVRHSFHPVPSRTACSWRLDCQSGC